MPYRILYIIIKCVPWSLVCSGLESQYLATFQQFVSGMVWSGNDLTHPEGRHLKPKLVSNLMKSEN